MRCIAANRSVLTALDQNATLADERASDYTAMTSDIDCMDIIQFADGWYSYPDLNTFDSDLLLDVLTIRNIKPNKIISPWNIRADNPSALPLTEIATRQLEALFNLSQLLFGLARAEQSNYTFRDLQLGQAARRFHEAGFKKFPNSSRPIDYLVVFQLVVNDVVKCGAIDVVFLMYKDPRLRCVKQKCLDLLANVSSIAEVARLILDHHSSFLIQLVQGIRDGHLIEEKIPSLSVLVRLCKVIVERNLLACYQHLIDMQFIDILLDLFENEQYKSNESIIYFIKFESFALQCVHVMLQCAEHVDMWSEKAQIRLVNYCCTLLYKSVLEDEDKHHARSRTTTTTTTTNHIIYAEQRGVVHSLSSGILTFLSVVRCRKEIGRFYRENEHFRELINVMKQKYSHRSEFIARDPSIACALDQVANVMFERKKRRHQQQSPVRDQHRKCANSLCQMIENDQIQFEDCPHCRSMSYCSNYCREVHWTLTHHLSCSPPVHSKRKDEESTVLCAMDRFPDLSSFDCRNDKVGSFGYASAFETLPVQLPQATVEVTDEITAELAYPSSSSSSSATTTEKKKSFKTLLSLLRINKKRK